MQSARRRIEAQLNGIRAASKKATEDVNYLRGAIDGMELALRELDAINTPPPPTVPDEAAAPTPAS